MNWLDQRGVPFRRANGERFIGTPLDLVDGFAEPGRRIVAVETGHPFVDRGYEFCLSAILQIAVVPEDDETWVAWLAEAPDATDLRDALAPYDAAFVLDDPHQPMLQVAPSEERLAEIAASRGKTPKGRPRPADDENDDDGDVPVSALLPTEALGFDGGTGEDFFARRGGVTAIGAGLIGPLLYANVVLGSPGGGGYLSAPTGAATLRGQIVGPSLWQTVWANVMPRALPPMSEGTWPAPCDRSVFAWLDPGLAGMPLGRKADGAKREANWHHHPALIAMVRRYRLDPPEEGVCSLSGVAGPVFRFYRRWSGGLQYPVGRWQDRHASLVRAYEPEGNGYGARPPADGEPARAFAKATRPLRLDDWSEVGLVADPVVPPEAGQRSWRRCERPPVVAAFQDQAELLRDELPGGGRDSALADGLPYRLRVSAALVDNVVQATTSRELPLYAVPGPAREGIATRINRLAGAVEATGRALGRAAREAARLGQAGEKSKGDSSLAESLRDALVRSCEEDVLRLQGALVARARAAPGRDAFALAAGAEERAVVLAAHRRARALFDGAFLASGQLDAPARRAALARKGLERGLRAILRTHGLTGEAGPGEETTHGRP